MKMMTEENRRITNPVFRDYVQRYEQIRRQTDQAIEALGIPFANDSRSTEPKLSGTGAVVSRNQDKSHYLNWISPACVACQTGENSHTSFISFKCHKSCYFCFNQNQENFAEFQVRNHDPEMALKKELDRGKTFDHIALTGGEPLLHPRQTASFFRFVNAESKETYTRLYTAGDLLTRSILAELYLADLDEIRFSVKQDETFEQHDELFSLMMLAKSYIPKVVVEMPVIPGTLEEMKELLLKLDAIGVDGINLLEFCFPIQNPKPFIERGFKLKYPPFETYYNYWYAGGLAIEESQRICKELLLFADQQKLAMGVHYCSLENKHTGQLYQQNKAVTGDPVRSFSEDDYFLKSAKVFGADREPVKALIEERGGSFEENRELGYLAFHVDLMDVVERELGVEIGVSSSVAEASPTGTVFREVAIVPVWAS